MILADVCTSIETLLDARPLTQGERIYWIGWLRTLVTLGPAGAAVQLPEPEEVARFEELRARVAEATR